MLSTVTISATACALMAKPIQPTRRPDVARLRMKAKSARTARTPNKATAPAWG